MRPNTLFRGEDAAYYIYDHDTCSIAFQVRCTGRYEPSTTKILTKYVRPGDVAIDVGANYGCVAVPLSRLVGPEGKVYALEPDPDNFEILKKNLQHNRCYNVTAIRVAASDVTGETEFFRDSEKLGCHSLSRDNVDNPIPPVTVPAARLDDLCVHFGISPEFIKTDTQGAEVRVFRGAKEALKSAHTVLLEFWPEGIAHMGDSEDELRQLLVGSGLIADIRPPVGRQAINIVARRA